MPDPCPCTGPGHCPHLARELGPADYALSRRTDEAGLAARRRWAREAGLAVAPEPERPKGCVGCGPARTATPAPAPAVVRQIATHPERRTAAATPAPQNPIVVATPTVVPEKAPTPDRPAILLRFPHGMGDAAHLRVVLAAIRRDRPEVAVDVASFRGKHSLLADLCRRSLAIDVDPIDPSAYAQVLDLAWPECHACYPDAPGSKAAQCLREVFGLAPGDPAPPLAIPADARARADAYAATLPGPFVLVHYQGNSSPEWKDLDHATARALCGSLIARGLTPVVLDWDGRSPLPDGRTIFNPGKGDPLWPHPDTGDGATIAALAARARLVVGIDSGPLHVAQLTATPCLGVWTRHHPYHNAEPGGDLVHLVPANHAGLIRGDKRVGLDYFAAHYRHEAYRDLAADLAAAVGRRLGIEGPGPATVAAAAPFPAVAPAAVPFPTIGGGRDAGAGKIKLKLVNRLAFGDVVVMSAALESLHQQFQGLYLTDVDVSVGAVFEGNPHVTRFAPNEPGVRSIEMHYNLINHSNQRPVHFLSGYVDHLAKELGIPMETQVNRPYIYLTEEEKGWLNQVEEITRRPTKFWLINCGSKSCYPNKQHLPEVYQEVVDHFFARGITFVQIGRAEHNGTILKRVIDLVGKTDDRQLIRLAYHCQGGVGPSTAMQHLCAAFEKCYTLADSVREPAHWWGYANQLSLVRHGCLPCATQGCWKSHVVPTEGKAVCERPVFGGSFPITRCMSLISPAMIIAAIESFYEGGRLSR